MATTRKTVKTVKKKTTKKAAAKRKPAKPRLLALPALKKKLIKHTDAFCKELLTKEYKDMCRVMAKGFCVDESPARRGNTRTWAAAVVGAVGYANALFNKTSEPHYTKAQLAKKMGIPLAEFNKHLKIIIKGFDLIEYDPDFTLPSMLPLNPLIAMATSPTLMEEIIVEECCGTDECCEGESCTMEGCAGEGCSMEECAREDCCQKQEAITSQPQ